MRPVKIVPLFQGVSSFLILLSLWGCNASLPSHDAAVPGISTPQIEAKQLRTLLPETTGQNKPVIVDFSSQYCLACQVIRPKLDKVIQQHPEITLMTVNLDKPNAHEKKLISTFQVQIAPYIAFVDKTGRVQKVLLDDAEQHVLDEAAARLARPAKPLTGPEPS